MPAHVQMTTLLTCYPSLRDQDCILSAGVHFQNVFAPNYRIATVVRQPQIHGPELALALLQSSLFRKFSHTNLPWVGFEHSFFLSLIRVPKSGKGWETLAYTVAQVGTLSRSLNLKYFKLRETPSINGLVEKIKDTDVDPDTNAAKHDECKDAFMLVFMLRKKFETMKRPMTKH